MIYLYGITEPAVGPPECAGLDDQPLKLLRHREVAGLFSEHAPERFEPDPDVMWRHDQVLEEAMRRGPVLPARFGTTFADLRAVAAVLEREQTGLRRALEGVRGCVELAVRVTVPAATDAPPEGGREYLLAKLAREQERQIIARRTLVPLAEYAVRSHTPQPAADAGELTASYLVRAADVSHFAGQVRALADRQPKLSLTCTGPWAPYSFVEAE